MQLDKRDTIDQWNYRITAIYKKEHTFIMFATIII